MTRVTGAGVFAAAVGQVANAAAAGLNVNNRELTHEAHPWRVKLGGQLQAAAAYTVIGVSRSLGMKHVDSATVVSERAASPTPFLGKSNIAPIEIKQTLEIFDAATGEVKFWGIVEDAEFQLGASADDKQIVASIQPHHFGEPITGAQFLNVRNSADNVPVPEVVPIDGPIVFNGWPAGDRRHAVPANDLAVTGNKSRRLFQPHDGEPLRENTHLFISLDAVQTPRGRQRYGSEYDPYSTAGMWTLRDAVRYLCAVGNVRGLIGNPTDDDLRMLPNTILYRTELPVGISIGDALDRLLGQYGFYWYVDPNAAAGDNRVTGAGVFNAAVQQVANVFAGATSTAKPRIRFVARGTGVEVDAKHAAPGSPADFATTNVNQFRARYSIASTVNEIHILGGYIQVEETCELQRVNKRKWAFNEADEYGDLPTPPYRPLLDPLKGDLAAVIPNLEEMFPAVIFGDLAKEISLKHVQRRRRFLPTLNLIGTEENEIAGHVDLRPRGTQHGIEVEMIDREQDDTTVPDEANKVWINLAEHPQKQFTNIRVADDECAIYFDIGHNPDTLGDDEFDAFLDSLGEDKRIRVTATIETDLRVQVRVRRKNVDNAPSVQTRPVVFVWEDEKRFPCRRISLTGPYASQWGEGTYTAQTPRTSTVIQQMREFGEQLLAGADQALISGQIQFMHLDYNVPLGGIVKKIAGREFHLLATHHNDEPKKYPQIVAIHYDVQNNLTTATLSAEPDSLLEAFA